MSKFQTKALPIRRPPANWHVPNGAMYKTYPAPVNVFGTWMPLGGITRFRVDCAKFRYILLDIMADRIATAGKHVEWMVQLGTGEPMLVEPFWTERLQPAHVWVDCKGLEIEVKNKIFVQCEYLGDPMPPSFSDPRIAHWYFSEEE